MLSFFIGLAGLLPQHPRTYRTAWRNRRELTRLLPPEEGAAAASAEGEETQSSP
jgi:hypothetical protein